MNVVSNPAATQSFGSRPSHDNLRTAKDFKRARRHSILVAVLKIALPVGAIGLVLVFVASIYLSFIPIADVSVDSAAIEGGNLVMNAPSMAGFDSKNRPYDVKAEKAIQDIKKPGIVRLEAIVANVPLDEKSQAKVLANSGAYNTKDEILKLQDSVSITGARGMDIVLQDANIDMKNGSMSSAKPVSVKTSNATIRADSVLVEQNGGRVLFRGRVETIIQPGSTNKLYGDEQ